MEDQAPQTSFDCDIAARSRAAICDLQTRAQAAMTARREQMSRLESQIGQQLDAIEEALATDHSSVEAVSEDFARDQADLERSRDELTSAQAAWQQERQGEEEQITTARQQLCEREGQLATLEATLQEREDALCQRERELGERAKECSSREQNLESALSQQGDTEKLLAERESAWAAERSSLEASHNELNEKLEQVTRELDAARADSKRQIDGLKERLEGQETTWDGERSGLENARGAAEQERDKLAHELLSVRDKLKTAEGLSDAASERDELKQKFELALADVQRFRASVAELEQELSRRPEGGNVDSAELTHLRAERDALAARVEELEREPPSAADTESAQQMADLQRRFEMAVEDVRDLKTKNAELESRLTSSQKQPIGGDDCAGSMDWESQKRRLLASLEGEGGDIEPQREQERTTIRHTIEMTDAVVAEKDRKITELNAQLAGRSGTAEESQTAEENAIQSLVNADEVVQEHRERAVQIEKELEEKLRAAELELSVERAKLAREKAEVEEWRLEMETFHKAREASEPMAAVGAPRRRWLSKLGLNGEESD